MADLREVLADLGPIDLELEDSDIITDVVAIIRVQRLSDTDDAIIIGATGNMGGVVCHGMLSSALLLHQQWMTNGPEDEE